MEQVTIEQMECDGPCVIELRNEGGEQNAICERPNHNFDAELRRLNDALRAHLRPRIVSGSR